MGARTQFIITAVVVDESPVEETWPATVEFPAICCDLSDALGGFEPCVLEFLLVCSEAGEFAVQSGQASMVRTGRSHLLVEFVDAALHTLELAFEPREFLFRLTALVSRRCG